jgi:apolipoprotein N-acyltransferase
MSIADVRPAASLSAAGAIPAALAAARGWRRALASFGLGAASVLGFAPFHLWPLLFLTLPGFVWLLDGIAIGEASRRRMAWRAAATGWWFGFGFFLAGLYWIGFAFLVEADKFAWLIPFAMSVLPAGLALFYALAAAAAILLWRPGAPRILALAVMLFAADWLRGHSLTGFPWNLWGYALTGNTPLMQATALFGIYGLTLFALVIFASPAALSGPLAASRRRLLLPALCLAFLAAGWIGGAVRLAGATDAVHGLVQMRIVQGNIPQAEKWKPENREWIFRRLTDLSSAPAAASAPSLTHIIWPETSVPFLFALNGAIASPETKATFDRLIPDGVDLILGAERVEATRRADGQYVIDRVYNSLFVLDAKADISAFYDKQHLVPFGEYVPFEETLSRIGIKQLTHLNTGFATGAERRPLGAGRAPAFSPLICYEAIFPGRAAGEGERPGWLLNLTNDAWFGTSTGPYQHLQQARVRAVEEGMPLVRAANTGVSAVIDSYGRIKASLPLNQPGFLDQALPVALAQTPFSTYREISLILVALVILLLYRIVITVE